MSWIGRRPVRIVTAIVVSGAASLAMGTVSSAATNSHLTDFDGDGRTDIAFGGGGLISVQYASGRTQKITTAALGTTVPGLGMSVADDVNGDGFTDLAIGAPVDQECDENCPPVYPPGEAFILFGSSGGLRTDNAVHLKSPYPAGTYNGSFGSSVAILRAPTPVLVVGEPLAMVAGQEMAGVVHLYTPSAAGAAGPLRTITQNSTGVPGAPETGDMFGAEVVASGANLVVSVDHEDNGTIEDAGMLTVFRFSAPTAFTAWGYTQDTAGVPGAVETRDRFGGHLAIDGHLVVTGIPDEAIGAAWQAGMIQPFTLTATGAVFGREITQNSPGIPDTAEPEDLFGANVAILRGCGGKPAYAVTSSETVGSVKYAGSGYVIPSVPSTACPIVHYIAGQAPLLGTLNQVGNPRLQGTVRTSATASDTLYLVTATSTASSAKYYRLTLKSPYTTVATRTEITGDSFVTHITPPAP